MHPSRRWPVCLMALLFLLLGAGWIVLVVLPAEGLAGLLDGLMADGEFETLRPDNLGVFRGIFVFGGLACLALAGVTYFGRWKQALTFLSSTWGDARTMVSGNQPAKTRLALWVAVLAIVGIAVVYRLEYIQSPLHHDEAYSYMAFGHSLRAAISDYHLPNNHVFHSVLVFLSTQLLGNAPWVVRLPAMLAGILLVPAMYALGRRHYGHWIGLGAGLLVAASPALVAYATNGRGYSMLAMFGLLLLILGDMVRTGKNRFAWALIILVAALGMFTNPSFLFSLGILYAWLVLECGFRLPAGYTSRLEFWKYLLVSGVSAVILTLALYIPIFIYSGPGSFFGNEFVTPVPWPDLVDTLKARLLETWAEWGFRVPAWMMALVATGWVLGLVFHKKISARRVPLQVAAFLWIVLLILVQRPNAWSKIWVFLLPLALLWGAAGVVGLLERLKISKIPLAALAVGGLFVLVAMRAPGLVSELPGLWLARGDEENAVRFVAEEIQSNDMLVVAPPDDAPAWYYAERLGLSSALYSESTDFERLFVLVNPGEGQTPESVLTERGPGVIPGWQCDLLEKFSKLQVFLCQER